MSSCPSGLTLGGTTAHFTVCYDPGLTNGPALATDALSRCEQDLATLAGFWPGTPPPGSSRVSIVVGTGGAFHSGAEITMYANDTTDGLGIPGLLVAELSEVFMATQAVALGKGFTPNYSHGEGLSRVLAAELYAAVAGRFASGRAWLTSARGDWVSTTIHTDQDPPSYGCAALFLNYLHHQLGHGWTEITSAADNTLALVAHNLGIDNAPADFFAIINRHYPPGTPPQLPRDPEGLPIDNLFPLTCLYVRHSVTDDGTSRSTDISASPDIIFKNSVVTDPQATYSTPVSVASDSESDPQVLTDRDNYLYVRVWNLGADATDVTATAYWSTVDDLVMPSRWTQIGEARYAAVPAGRIVKISSPGITWSQATIPAPGQYCLITIVGSAGDPAPTPPSFATRADFDAYIESNNNVAVRGLTVADPISPVIALDASNETPAGRRVTLVSVSGSGFTPGGVAAVTVDPGGQKLVKVARDGQVSWGFSIRRLPCGAPLVATAHDNSSGLDSNEAAAEVFCPGDASATDSD